MVCQLTKEEERPMAYKHGSGSVQVELRALQEWAENTDEDLYGKFGKPGLVDEHRERMMRETTESVNSDKFSKRMVTLCAIFAALGNLPKIIEWIHSLVK
jgi:hypothetical protein